MKKLLSIIFIILVISFSCADNSVKKTSCIDENLIKDGPCTREFNPVCGCDNITYSNICLAKNSGVISFSQGKCD